MDIQKHFHRLLFLCLFALSGCVADGNQSQMKQLKSNISHNKGTFKRLQNSVEQGKFNQSHTKQTLTKKLQQQGQQKYKRVVEIVANSNILKNVFKNEIATSPNIAVTHEGDFSEFRIIINIDEGKTSSVKSLKPRLSGKLARENTLTTFKITYILTNLTGKILTEGFVKRTVSSERNIYPRLVSVNELPPKNMISAVTEIMANIVPYIKASSWYTTVIGYTGAEPTGLEKRQHVIIASGQEAGINLNDIFITATLPKTTLRVVTFETTPAGLGRAILRVIKGKLPAIGRQLMAVK